MTRAWRKREGYSHRVSVGSVQRKASSECIVISYECLWRESNANCFPRIVSRVTSPALPGSQRTGGKFPTRRSAVNVGGL